MMKRVYLSAMALIVLPLAGAEVINNGNMELSHEIRMEPKDELKDIQAEGSHRPIAFSFDLPFQNTPATGHVDVYSVPTKSGVLVVASLSSEDEPKVWLQKDRLYQLFESILVPHLFYHPKVFDQGQEFNYLSSEENKDEATFSFTFQDQGVQKRLEGYANAKGKVLYLNFYIGF